ncbi:MAG TPA: formate dehydrogenase [Alphaproteobacteria bacterium]|nr:formate dehydrogenase [Alphaproteobacteria bacterium]
MTKQDKTGKPTRREFFRTAGAGVGAAVVGVAGAAGLGGEKAKAGQRKDDTSRGYRLTDHVKRYYDLAK